MKKIIASLLILILLTGCCGALAERGAPDIPPVLVKNPQDAAVKEGGKCSFSISQTGARGITWRLRDPDTEETILCTNAGDRFPGLGVSGKNGETLTLSNVPAALDGWEAYCTLSNGAGSTVSRYAKITVTGKSGAAPTAAPSAAVTPAPKPAGHSAEGYVHVKAVGCVLQVLDKDGKPTGAEESDLYFRNCADFRVTCTTKGCEYWIINGVKYQFESFPGYITVYNLTDDTVFECCGKNNKPSTLLSESEIQNARTGETLILKADGAKMCHVKGSNYGAGGYFDSFDFTNDFKNRATEKTEKGGRVTVKVISKNGVSAFKHWQFNGADLVLSQAVTYFFVYDQNRSVTYRPLSSAARPGGNSRPVSKGEANGEPDPDVPATMEQLSRFSCSVSCTGCTFNCDTISGCSQGYVPFGSQITVNVPAGKTLYVNDTPAGDSVTLTVYSSIRVEAR